MASWPDRRILDLLGIEIPILLAPMAGPGTEELAIAVAEAGGLGSLPCSQLSVEQMSTALATIRQRTARPINLNFFCHSMPAANSSREMEWRAHLAPYYVELGVDPSSTTPAPSRRPFDEDICAFVESALPQVVSFHFGLPPEPLLARVKNAECKVIGSATTVSEARWLEERGCDAVIAMGAEAGGHRGTFLTSEMARQVGTFALVPQIADAVEIPVIAAGAVADARGIVAAFALGASAVQMGTAYLFCPEAKVSPLYQRALADAADEDTEITNVFTGRPARGIVNRLMREQGPLSPHVPPFPLAAAALAPLRARSEAAGLADFTNLWAGQSVRLGRALPAGELTTSLARDALDKWSTLGG